jgi:trehalose-6-phosphate synthase
VLKYASIADVFVATPSADGYNITPLEFATVNGARKGTAPAVVLSEGAGSSWDLRGTPRHPGAIITPPPTDTAAAVSTLAGALEQAVSMVAAERRARLHTINEGVRHHPVDKWFRQMIAVDR